jgi:hypothetical protein
MPHNSRLAVQARNIHELPTAADDASAPGSFSFLGEFNVLSSTTRLAKAKGQTWHGRLVALVTKPRALSGLLFTILAVGLLVPADAVATSAAATEHFFAVASRTEGFAETRWRTRVWVVAGAEPADVTFEFYPTSLTGLSGPAQVASRSVAAGSQLYLEDLLGDLWGINGNGAVRVLSTSPVAAFARVVNVKMPLIFEGGTFGQAMASMTPDQAIGNGVFPGLFNERISDESGFRSNLGWFNPNAGRVTVTARVITRDGAMLGERTFEVAGLSQWLGSVFDVVWTVPQNQRELKHFFVTYEATGGPLYLYASVVDNVTGDAVTVLPLPAP